MTHKGSWQRPHDKKSFDDSFDRIFGVVIDEGAGRYRLYPDGRLRIVKTGKFKKVSIKNGHQVYVLYLGRPNGFDEYTTRTVSILVKQYFGEGE